MFELLLSVSGIGPKGALAILSSMTVSDIQFAIAGGDAKAFAAAPGVGKKTAERVIIDLKDKVGDFDVSESASAGITPNITSERTEAVSALMSLGYSKTEADQADFREWWKSGANGAFENALMDAWMQVDEEV